MRRVILFFLIAAAMLVCADAIAQPASTEDLTGGPVQKAAKTKAKDLFKKGDSGGALDALETALDDDGKGHKSKAPDFDTGVFLAQTSFEFAADEDTDDGVPETDDQLAKNSAKAETKKNKRTDTKSVADAALKHLSKVKGKVSATDESHAYEIAGELTARILGDKTSARSYYEAAVKANSRNTRAKLKLHNLDIEDEESRAKAAANDVLRKRAEQQASGR